MSAAKLAARGRYPQDVQYWMTSVWMSVNGYLTGTAWRPQTAPVWNRG